MPLSFSVKVTGSITISIEPSNGDGGGGGGVATDDVDDGGSILVERDSKSIFCDLPVNELNMICFDLI